MNLFTMSKNKKRQERLTCKEKNELIFTKKKHFRFSLNKHENEFKMNLN